MVILQDLEHDVEVNAFLESANAMMRALASVEEYFEIFPGRMVMCRRAAQFLGCQFSLAIDGNRLM